jgi:hypothetical protein
MERRQILRGEVPPLEVVALDPAHVNLPGARVHDEEGNFPLPEQGDRPRVWLHGGYQNAVHPVAKQLSRQLELVFLAVVGARQEHAVVHFLERRLDPLGDLGEKGIQDVLENDTYCVGLPFYQAPGDDVRLVPELLDRLEDPFPGFSADLRRSVEHTRYRGSGDLGSFRDVLEGGYFFHSFVQSFALYSPKTKSVSTLFIPFFQKPGNYRS